MSPEPSKRELRARFAAGRQAMTDAEREAARRAVRDHVLARASGWAWVAAYEPLRTEPGSIELLTSLIALRVRVMVPVTLPDRDLDWREWPDGDPLGLDAVSAADAVLVPSSAIAFDGTRLGRGGGSYDRALGRARTGVPLAALLYDDELVASLPRDEWDVPVTAAVRPMGWTDLPTAASG